MTIEFKLVPEVRVTAAILATTLMLGSAGALVRSQAPWLVGGSAVEAVDRERVAAFERGARAELLAGEAETVLRQGEEFDPAVGSHIVGRAATLEERFQSDAAYQGALAEWYRRFVTTQQAVETLDRLETEASRR